MGQRTTCAPRRSSIAAKTSTSRVSGMATVRPANGWFSMGPASYSACPTPPQPQTCHSPTTVSPRHSPKKRHQRYARVDTRTGCGVVPRNIDTRSERWHVLGIDLASHLCSCFARNECVNAQFCSSIDQQIPCQVPPKSLSPCYSKGKARGTAVALHRPADPTPGLLATPAVLKYVTPSRTQGRWRFFLLRKINPVQIRLEPPLRHGRCFCAVGTVRCDSVTEHQP